MESAQAGAAGTGTEGNGVTESVKSFASSPSASQPQLPSLPGSNRLPEASRVYARKTHGKYAAKRSSTQILTLISSSLTPSVSTTSAAAAVSAPAVLAVSSTPSSVPPHPELPQEAKLPPLHQSGEVSTSSPYCAVGEVAIIKSDPSGHLVDGASVPSPVGYYLSPRRRHLRRRFRADLELIRNLQKELETHGEKVAMATAGSVATASYPARPPPIEIPNTEIQFSSTGHSPPIPASHLLQSAPAAITPASNIFSQRRLNISVISSMNKMPTELMEKRTPKANKYYKNSELFLTNDKPLPRESHVPKKSKVKGRSTAERKVYSHTFKKCSSLLVMLMKHKFGWVFNKPVDAPALGLHDYFDIIKYPMDLGTIKERLSKKFYSSPKEFAEDVRLTFSNAMKYNPKGQDVHIMAEMLLKIFEDNWPPIEAEMNYYSRKPLVSKRPAPVDIAAMRLDTPGQQPMLLETTERTMSYTPNFGSQRAPKKPKAKDINKREMTFAEKRKLSSNLANLPPEKLNQIVQIIKKNNLMPSHLDDEIVVDIDSIDTETLWELDRFVSNYKKNLSKHKRKAEIAMLEKFYAEQNAQGATDEQVRLPMANNLLNQSNAFALKPPHEEEMGENAQSSSSTSSSSSDSSSSDSSDSSSAFGSDAKGTS